MAERMNVGLRNAILDSGINTAIGNDGRINVYTGTQPATADLAPSGTLLGTLSLSSTAFGAGASGVVTAAAIGSDTSADNSGTAGWGRIYKSAQGAGVSTTNPHFDFSIGSGEDMTMDNYAIVAGGTIAISSLTLSLPAS